MTTGESFVHSAARGSNDLQRQFLLQIGWSEVRLGLIGGLQTVGNEGTELG